MCIQSLLQLSGIALGQAADVITPEGLNVARFRAQHLPHRFHHRYRLYPRPLRAQRHRSGRDEIVSSVEAAPLSVCWSSYSTPQKALGKGQLSGLGESRMVFSWDGRVWSRGGVPGWGMLWYLPLRSMLISVTPRAFRAFSLRPDGVRFSLPAPKGFTLANYVVAVERNRGELAAVALVGDNAPYFQPLASFEVEVVDLANGENAMMRLGGFPLGIGPSGNRLIADTTPFSSAATPLAQRRFFLDTFSITKVHGKLVLRSMSHERCAGPLQSFAGEKPVLVTVGGHRVFVGGASIRFGKKVGKIKQVVGEPGVVLVVKSDGSFGLAGEPRWTYHRLGSLGVGDLIGAGHNRAGFWLAQSGGSLGKIRITEVSKHGVIQTVNVAIRCSPAGSSSSGLGSATASFRQTSCNGGTRFCPFPEP